MTFKKRSTRPVPIETLREQLHHQRLTDFDGVVGLGGVDYRAAVTQAFKAIPVRLDFPFAGLSLGYT